jgi:hypothetical protein
MKTGDLVMILDSLVYKQYVNEIGLIMDVSDESRFIYPYLVMVCGLQIRFSSHEIALVQHD